MYQFSIAVDNAEDATQDILIRLITGLGGFQAKSGFRTWAYRVACNTLLTLSKQRMEQHSLTFEEFGQDLAQGQSNESLYVEHDVSKELLLEEVKVGCTLAMLMCLDRNHRLAYILGEILDLDHRDAAEVLAISPDAFRKRLSRANAQIVSFMTSHCGLVNPANACRCSRRLDIAIQLGRIQPEKLLFSPTLTQAKRFPEVLNSIRQLEETRRAAALYRSHLQPEPSTAFTSWLTTLLDEMPDACPPHLA